jgi:hypothetical protein
MESTVPAMAEATMEEETARVNSSFLSDVKSRETTETVPTVSALAKMMKMK